MDVTREAKENGVMKRASTVLCGVGLLLAVTAGVRAAETIRIGALFSVTGPAAYLGSPEA